jgi:hypothetical protein
MKPVTMRTSASAKCRLINAGVPSCMLPNCRWTARFSGSWLSTR